MYIQIIHFLAGVMYRRL